VQNYTKIVDAGYGTGLNDRSIR